MYSKLTLYAHYWDLIPVTGDSTATHCLRFLHHRSIVHCYLYLVVHCTC